MCRLALLALLLLMPQSAFSQNVSAKPLPAELARVMASTDALDDISSRPWHLKADVEVFDENGKNPRAGTMEIWQSGENRRVEFKVGEFSRTELRADGKNFYSMVGDFPSDTADEILTGFLHPGPQRDDLSDATPEFREQEFGKQAFDCVMLTHTIHGVNKTPLGLFPTYCAVHGSTEVRVAYPSGMDVLLVKRVGTFANHHVSVELSVSRGVIERGHGKIVSLSGLTEEGDAFKRTDGLSPVGESVARISGGVIAGAKIGGQAPVYPVSARQAHIGGTIVLHALIGVDGAVHSLRVMSAGDADLAIAAIAAVRTWRYKPYLLNGLPTSVDTTITVNFNLRPM